MNPLRHAKDLVPIPARRRIKIARARFFERIGSELYSKPAINGLDVKVLEHLRGYKEFGGTFLEIGANDGYSQSNTYYLERHKGWTGILIEPLPHLYKSCARIRKNSTCFNYACAGDAATSTVTIRDMNLMSVALGLQAPADELPRLSPGRDLIVPARTMSSLIDQTSLEHLDFMSIDVEGAELAVLGGLDLERHCPEFLLVETESVDDVRHALDTHMQLVDTLSFHDYLFRRREPRGVS